MARARETQTSRRCPAPACPSPSRSAAPSPSTWRTPTRAPPPAAPSSTSSSPRARRSRKSDSSQCCGVTSVEWCSQIWTALDNINIHNIQRRHLLDPFPCLNMHRLSLSEIEILIHKSFTDGFAKSVLNNNFINAMPSPNSVNNGMDQH